MTRDVFRPPAGYEFLFMDFSQIELRLAAEYLKDEDMKLSFVNGVDFHSLTAARTYGVDIKDVTKDQRALSKILNFSILYGAGLRRITFALRYGAAGSKPLTLDEARAALKQFKWEDPNMVFTLTVNDERPDGPPIRTDEPKRTVDDLNDEELYVELARALLEAYHRENPLVKQFTHSASRRAEREGYVMTAFGLMIPVPKERSHIAANAIIQGSAAGLMKATLTRGEDICYDYCEQNNLEMWKDVKMITTIHDEFGILLPVGHSLALARMLYPRMIDWPQFSVKLDVEFAVVQEGSSWAYKKDLKLDQAA
jgi:DNA polymerase I-like protein with 3'-5' exonuclease and polymerase domains